MDQMRTLLVSFQINNGQVRSGFEKFLRDCPAWWHSLPNVWIVVTPLTAKELMGHVKHFLVTEDSALVLEVDLEKHKPSGWLTKDSHQWLADPMAAASATHQKPLAKPDPATPPEN